MEREVVLQLREKLARKEKIEQLLETLRRQLEQFQDEKRQLELEFRAEQEDVERLERVSLASIFYSIVSKKEERLDQERAEAYAAQMRLETAIQQVEATQRELARLREQRAALDGVEREYEIAFRALRDQVLAQGGEHGAQLMQLEQELGSIQAQKTEVAEALSAGARALDQIERVLQLLRSAENWGTFDMFADSLLVDMAKHSKLDDAQQEIYVLQNLLSRYHAEVADVRIDASIQVQIDGFLHFADYFFDGIFADWAVLDRIQSSSREMETVREKVLYAQSKLEAIRQGLIQREQACLASRTKLLEL